MTRLIQRAPNQLANASAFFGMMDELIVSQQR
jgi:hypothetical protein